LTKIFYKVKFIIFKDIRFTVFIKSRREFKTYVRCLSTGGKQYKVEEGDVLRIEKVPGEIGSSISFDEVLMFSDGEKIRVGNPLLEGISISGHIVEQDKAKKIIVFKYKRRKRYRRKQGHRQPYTAIKIDSITV
jgi:large subunit ribosomal protein L21